MLVLDQSTCGDTRAALATEWITPNGAGGYASLTVAGACTRREHGMLVAALEPPGRQTVLLAALEERLFIEGREFVLTTVAADEVEGSGATRHLLSLGRTGRLVRSEHLVDGLRLERRLAVPAHADAVLLSYRVLEVPPRLHRRPVMLEVSPLFAYQPVNGNDSVPGDGELDLTAYLIEDKVRFEPRPPLPPLFFTHESDAFQPDPVMVENLPLPEGAPAGAVPEIALGRPGTFIYQLGAERPAYLAVSAREPIEGPPRRLESMIVACESPIRNRPLTSARGRLTTALQEAVDAFVLSSGRSRHWINSDYPGGGNGWHEAMIALPGLTLSTGLHDVTREVLISAARTMSRGRLPALQTIGLPATAERDEPTVRMAANELASLHTTLRFFDTAELYLRATGDVRTARRVLYPALRDCLAHLLAGATGARITQDGLLETEAPPALLGQRGQAPPDGDSAIHALRAGLNALWCASLAAIRDLAQEFNDQAVAEEAGERWELARKMYNERFWNAERGCLYNAIVGGTPDPTVRPIQILAAGQRHQLLSRERASSVVAVVERELLTPRGLRSLAPGEPGYVGLEYLLHADYPDLGLRGSAYPWLLGPFAAAYLDVHHYSKAAKDRIASLLSGFVGHLHEGAIGQISERFDGDAPHTPRGQPASATSVAELLRVSLDYLGGEV